MHSVIKRLNEWKEVTIDAAVLSFNYLQVYYVHELLRGFCDGTERCADGILLALGVWLSWNSSGC
jgi:hypothetical protein